MKELGPARFGLLYLGLVVVLTVLLGRSFYLQVLAGSSWRTQAEGNRVTAEPLVAPRGLLLDRYGKKLVENVPSTDVVLDPALLPRQEDEAVLLDRLPKLLVLTPEEVQQAMTITRQKQRLVVIKKAVPHEQLLRLQEEQDRLPGVRLVSGLVRQYPYAAAAAHVIGYTSAVTADELNKNQNLLPVEQTGKAGLERQYDEQLRGQLGAIYTQINARGAPLQTMGTRPARPGEDIQLTLDIGLQQFIFEQLQEKAGAVVVLEPASGAVRALVSSPAYDPNILAQPEHQAEINVLLRQPLDPLFNRAVDGMYPPGSTIKPLLAAAALEEKLITPSTTIISRGGITVGPWQFPDWKPGGHGATNVAKALAESVNTFFYAISGGYEGQMGLGVDMMTTYLRRFGWGHATKIDLPNEAAGFLPSPAWKEKTKHERWYIGDTYHLAIGQGDVLVTPLQLSAATGMIAQRGRQMPPHLKAVDKPNGQLVRLRDWDTVRSGMRAAVTDGSARGLNALVVPLAAKTGTAQTGGGSEETHAWLTSFGPFNEPKLVVTVLLEKGGEGDKDAVPVARAIWQWLIEHDRL